MDTRIRMMLPLSAWGYCRNTKHVSSIRQSAVSTGLVTCMEMRLHRILHARPRLHLRGNICVLCTRPLSFSDCCLIPKGVRLMMIPPHLPFPYTRSKISERVFASRLQICFAARKFIYTGWTHRSEITILPLSIDTLNTTEIK